MRNMIVTTQISDELKAAGFEFAVVHKKGKEQVPIACFRNRFDAILFIHANTAKEKHGITDTDRFLNPNR